MFEGEGFSYYGILLHGIAELSKDRLGPSWQSRVLCTVTFHGGVVRFLRTAFCTGPVLRLPGMWARVSSSRIGAGSVGSGPCSILFG